MADRDEKPLTLPVQNERGYQVDVITLPASFPLVAIVFSDSPPAKAA